MSCNVVFIIFVLAWHVACSSGWVTIGSDPKVAASQSRNINNNDDIASGPSASSPATMKTLLHFPRRELIQNFAILMTTPLLIAFPDFALASEKKERCYAEDPRCGPDGKLRDNIIVQPIPRVTNKITYVVQLIVDIGERREEAGYIRFGLYGDDCPESVKQMLQFLTRGISSLTEVDLSNDIGMQTAPVSLLDGGAVPCICSEKAVYFGVPSQSKAYAMSRGLRTAGDNFLPQLKPPTLSIEKESFPRPHSVAGLVSIPMKGIGHGQGENELDDKAFSNAFMVTADEIPEFDGSKTTSSYKRRVIGQIIDNESMTFLARLASLPIQKGVVGVIPGQREGPPLLRVTIRDVGVRKVQEDATQNKTKK